MTRKEIYLRQRDPGFRWRCMRPRHFRYPGRRSRPSEKDAVSVHCPMVVLSQTMHRSRISSLLKSKLKRGGQLLRKRQYYRLGLSHIKPTVFCTIYSFTTSVLTRISRCEVVSVFKLHVAQE